MKTRALLWGAVLLTVSTTAAGYHIPDPHFARSYTLGIGIMTNLCESLGPSDPVNPMPAAYSDS